jgi:hypothetical protein
MSVVHAGSILELCLEISNFFLYQQDILFLFSKTGNVVNLQTSITIEYSGQLENFQSTGHSLMEVSQH